MDTQVASTIFDIHQKPATSPTATKEEINALHLQFSEYGQNAKHWLRQCQMLLPHIRDEEVWKKKGFSSIYEYAAKLAGMSHNSVNEALRVYDALQDKPILKGEVEKHGTHKVKTILTVATQDTQEFWLKKLNEMSKSTLETYVREYKSTFKKGLPGEGQRVQERNEDMSNNEFGLGDSENGGNEGGNSEARTRQTASVYMKLEVEVIEKLKRMKGDRDWNELMKDLLDGKVENIHGFGEGGSSESESAATEESEGKPAPVNTGKRYVPRKIQKYVTNKTSGLCAYPGCAKPYEILHHTERFSLHSTYDPDTLRPMCKAHERLAHEGLIENEESQPVEFIAGDCGNNGMGGEKEAGGRTGIKVNWSLKAEPDTNNPKHAIDEKVNEYYMPKLK